MAQIPLLLLSLAAGYGVLILSERQGRPLDVLGRIVGGVIVLVAAAGLLCAAWHGCKRMTNCQSNKSCAYAGKADCASGQANAEGHAPMDEKAK